MTTLYFVRHAQPDYRTGDNPTFALSEEGEKDALLAADHLKDIRFDAAVSSPYRRSIDTIRPIILSQKLKLKTDIRLRERDNAGRGSNTPEMFRRRWNDFDYHGPVHLYQKAGFVESARDKGQVVMRKVL